MSLHVFFCLLPVLLLIGFLWITATKVGGGRVVTGWGVLAPVNHKCAQEPRWWQWLYWIQIQQLKVDTVELKSMGKSVFTFRYSRSCLPSTKGQVSEVFFNPLWYINSLRNWVGFIIDLFLPCFTILNNSIRSTIWVASFYHYMVGLRVPWTHKNFWFRRL